MKKRNLRWLCPLSLVHLFETCHSSETEKPAVQKEIRAIYNVEKALAPYINKNIKYYNVPHCFKFSLKHAFAIMQWKYCSTDNDWKPRPPDLECEVSENIVSSIPVMQYGIATDVNQLYTLLGVHTESQKSVSSSHIVMASTNKNLAAMARMTSTLHNLSLTATLEQSTRLVAEEALGLDTNERYKPAEKELAEFQRYMKAHSDNQEGFIMWINHERAAETGCFELQNIVPDILHFQGASAYLNYTHGSDTSETVKKATSIASVCKKILSLADQMFITKNSTEFRYSSKALTILEQEFYLSRASTESVLNNLKTSIESEVDRNPYQLIPVKHLASEVQANIAAQTELRREAMNRQLALLNKPRYRNFTNIDFDSLESRGGRSRGRGRGHSASSSEISNNDDTSDVADIAGGRVLGRGRGRGRRSCTPTGIATSDEVDVGKSDGDSIGHTDRDFTTNIHTDPNIDLSNGDVSDSYEGDSNIRTDDCDSGSCTVITAYTEVGVGKSDSDGICQVDRNFTESIQIDPNNIVVSNTDDGNHCNTNDSDAVNNVDEVSKAIASDDTDVGQPEIKRKKIDETSRQYAIREEFLFYLHSASRPGRVRQHIAEYCCCVNFFYDLKLF